MASNDQVRRSIAASATLLADGDRVAGSGFFYQPTVLEDVRPGMAAVDEEIFGPVAALVVADDVDDAIKLANTSDYGLSSNLCTNDLERARTDRSAAFVNL